MSIKFNCTLCFCQSTEYQPLQNENGECNELYEITVKYFDPMLINEENDNFPQENKVLCRNCWLPIKEFNEFQQNIIKSRALLEKCEITPHIIKMENEINLEEIKINGKAEPYCENTFDNDHYRIKIEENINDIGICEKASASNEDDRMSLISWTNAKVSKKQIESTLKSEDSNNTINIKIRKGKKLKNIDINVKTKEENVTSSGKIDDSHSKCDIKEVFDSDAFIREWKPILECDLCEETASSFDELRFHFRDEHKSRFYIKCCDRKFYRRYVLVNHIQLHLNPETHKCELCGKVCANKNNLKIHKKLIHEEVEQLECEVCHKLFNLKTSLNRHLLTHVKGDKDFICQDCGKAYVLEAQLKTHIKTAHNVDRICDQCGKTFRGIHALKKHLLEHAGIEKLKFPCDDCGIELNSRNSLKRHKATCHHDGSTVYVCGVCGKIAANERALLNHKKYVHEEKRNHICTYCNKAFKRPKNLLEHIATHTGQDLYQCPHCPQTFKVSANMHHHRKKMHPVEWEEGRKNRLQVPKIDINHAKNQVVL